MSVVTLWRWSTALREVATDGEAYYAMAVLSEFRIKKHTLKSLREAPVETLLLHAAILGMHAQSSHRASTRF